MFHTQMMSLKMFSQLPWIQGGQFSYELVGDLLAFFIIFCGILDLDMVEMVFASSESC